MSFSLLLEVADDTRESEDAFLASSSIPPPSPPPPPVKLPSSFYVHLKFQTRRAVEGRQNMFLQLCPPPGALPCSRKRNGESNKSSVFFAFQNATWSVGVVGKGDGGSGGYSRTWSFRPPPPPPPPPPPRNIGLASDRSFCFSFGFSTFCVWEVLIFPLRLSHFLQCHS